MENKGTKLLLDAKGVCKAFSGVPALTDASFELRYGEVHALMGENGAGKSTLSKIITGIYTADKGQVCLEGVPVRFTNTREASTMGVSIVTQEFSLLPDFSVAENIFLTDKNYYKKGFISNKKAMAEETRKLLKLFEMESYIDVYEKVERLSVAQMQVVEIIKAVSTHAKAIILDEPTASLSTKEIDMLFKLVRRLKSEGVGFIIVSHKINEIYEISDRITVLRDGKMVLSGVRTSELSPRELIKAMVGREVSDLYGAGAQEHSRDIKASPVVFEVRGISDANLYVKNVSLKVRKGEIAGLSGLVGAGRTELVRCIFGADKRSSGEVFINGKKLRLGSIRESIHSKIGFVSEDRKFDGLLQELSIINNICLVDIAANGGVSVHERDNERKCADMVERLGIKLHDIYAPVKSLSGGNQQKVLLAKWLLLDPDVLIVDEPTRGVDIGAKADIYAIIRALAASGVAVLMVSSEMPEIIGICDTVYVMREGRITAQLDSGEISEEQIGYYSTIGERSRASEQG